MYSKSIDEIYKLLESSKDGLNKKQVKERLEKYGKNQLSKDKKINPLLVFFKQLLDPLVYVLLSGFVLSVILKEYTDATIIIIVILLNAFLSSYQECKAEKSLKALSKLTTPTCIVKREGKLQEVNVLDVVIGDIIILQDGKNVPADIRLITSSYLLVDESSLTGESIAVEKKANILCDEKTPLAERCNMVFMSTNIIKGNGEGIVIKTGMDTQIGKIAKLLKKEKKSITPLQKKLNEISKILAILTVILCLFIFILSITQNRDKMEMLITAISLAVAVIPEGKGVLTWHSLLSKNKYQVTYQSYI